MKAGKNADKNAEQAYVCAKCEQGFKSPRALTQHSRIIHRGGKAFGYPPADKVEPTGTTPETSVMGPVVGVCGECGSTNIVLRRLKAGETISSEEEPGEEDSPQEVPELSRVRAEWYIRVNGTDYDFKVSEEGEVEFIHVYFPSGTICNFEPGERFTVEGTDTTFEAHNPPRAAKEPDTEDESGA